jgi:hypothetical protein
MKKNSIDCLLKKKRKKSSHSIFSEGCSATSMYLLLSWLRKERETSKTNAFGNIIGEL